MAKFKEHILVAAVVSTFASTAVLSFNFLSQIEILSLFILGIVSTMIPDLDSDFSKPLRLTYNIFSIFIPFFIIYYLIKTTIIRDINNNIINLILIYLVSFFLIFIFFRLLMKITKHRGIIHSIPMAILSSLIIMLIFYYFNLSKNFILLSGLFVFLGFCTHLILDEVYSIIKLQKSFGTAFKLFSKNNIYGTLIIYFLIFIAIYIFPYKFIDYLYIIKKFKNFI